MSLGLGKLSLARLLSLTAGTHRCHCGTAGFELKEKAGLDGQQHRGAGTLPASCPPTFSPLHFSRKPPQNAVPSGFHLPLNLGLDWEPHAPMQRVWCRLPLVPQAAGQPGSIIKR